jgi:hypothetical protein
MSSMKGTVTTVFLATRFIGSSPQAVAKEPSQYLGAVAGGIEFKKIGSAGRELLAQRAASSTELALTDLAPRKPEVGNQSLTRFRVADGRQPAGRRFDFVGGIDGDAHEIMTKCYRTELFAIHVKQEIGQYQDQNSAPSHVQQRIERRSGIAAQALGLSGQKIGQQTQGVLPTFAGLEDPLDSVAADNHPHPIVIMDCREREQGG